jgi:hypothetical protein
MQNLIKESLARNGGNGSAAINARGISHRGWTPEQRAAAAADAVLGATHVVPTLGQAATAFNVSATKIRAELKTREAAAEAAERAIDEDYAVNRLIDAWLGASPKAREVAVREIGVAAAWDVIARIVG